MVIVCVFASCSEKPHQAMLKELKSQDANVRRGAVQMLGLTGDPAMQAPLISAMQHDPDESVRSRAAVSLGELGDPRATPALALKLLGSDTLYVRGHALEALEKLRDPLSLVGIVALWRLDVWPPRPTGTANDILQVRAIDVAVAFGPDAVTPMVVALSDSNPTVRVAAMRTLVRVDPARARDELPALLNDATSRVRKEAAAHLSSFAAGGSGAEVVDPPNRPSTPCPSGAR